MWSKKITHEFKRQLNDTVADAIAVLVLGLQYSLIFLMASLYFGTAFPRGIAIVVFPPFAGIAVLVWHNGKVAETTVAWGKFALISVFVGVAFFGGDWLLAYINGQSNPLHFAGGLLGIPLTVLVCPVGTMVCVAGLVRALYLSRTEYV